MTIRMPFGGQTYTLENEYEIFGAVRVKTLRPLMPHQDLYAHYEAAVNNYKNICAEIQEITKKLNGATGDMKNTMLTQLKFLKKSAKPEAVKSMREARTAFDEARRPLARDIARCLETKKELRKSREKRISRIKPNPFRRSANVVAAKASSSNQKKPDH